MSDIKKKLEEDIASISWQEILPHAKRDAVVVIDRQLDLAEVAEAIALDNTSLVSNWIAEKLVTKPSATQLTDWNSNPQQEFTAAIVQPFVIIKPITKQTSQLRQRSK
jgi:hypothetical protein